MFISIILSAALRSSRENFLLLFSLVSKKLLLVEVKETSAMELNTIIISVI